MKTRLVLTTCVSLLALGLSAQAQFTEVAYDDANLASYAPQSPGEPWPSINGGFGYGLWTPLADTGGGGTYMEGVGANNRQVDGNWSYALYSGGGAYDISRPLDTSITQGQFSIITRFDLAGAGPNLINIRTGNNLSGFGSGELLSFGIVNGNELSYTDGSGFNLLSSGEARGDAWDWTVNFNTVAGTYSLSVTNLGGGYATTVSGNLELTGDSVGSFAAINSSSGNNQNLIFDAPEFQTVPEPATISLFGLGAASLLRLRRRS